jgi:hypothetical protein
MSDEENAALVIKAGVEQLFVPFHRLLDQLLGPAATEVGLGFGDSVKVWRLKRQVRLLQEVKRLIDQSGKDIHPIATRLFFPVLEAASIEGDDEMQTRWASLLANEAISTGSVHPSFIEILKQMTPDDAKLLDRLFDWCQSQGRGNPINTNIHWWSFRFHNGKECTESDGEPISNLFRLGLIVSDYDLEEKRKRVSIVGNQPQVFSETKLKEHDSLSGVAVRFVKACREPQKKVEGEGTS